MILGVFEKQANSVLDYKFDWAALTNGTGDSDWLASGETISTDTGDVVVSVSPSETGGLAIDSSSLTDTNTSVTVWLSGGVAGEVYHVTCKVTTGAGRTDERTIEIDVLSPSYQTEITAYASVAQYKAWVTMRGGQISSDADDDNIIADLLDAASRYIDNQTGRRFYPDSSDGTYYYKAYSDTFVKLPDFASITTVSVDFANTRSYTALTLSTDYDPVPDNYSAEGVPIRGIELSPLSGYGYFPVQRKGIKVVGKRGWSACPENVKDSVLAICQNLYGTRSGQTSAGKITVTGAGVVIRPEDVPAFAQKVIEHYRNYL